MPQSKYEICHVLEWDGDEAQPAFREVGRYALAGRTGAEWATWAGHEDVRHDPRELEEIQRRLRTPRRPAAAFTAGGRPHLVFYHIWPDNDRADEE